MKYDAKIYFAKGCMPSPHHSEIASALSAIRYDSIPIIILMSPSCLKSAIGLWDC
jgi:hypothetical protein